MAGTNSAFDASVFRTAIRNAMVMGLPTATEERATFKWKVRRDYEVADSNENPFNWSSTPDVTTTYPDIQVTCAVEFFSKGGDTQGTRVGELDVSRIIITLLDEEWEEVLLNGDDNVPDFVQMDDAEYKVLFVGPPIGLFDVTVYQVFIQAIDEV